MTFKEVSVKNVKAQRSPIAFCVDFDSSRTKLCKLGNMGRLGRIREGEKESEDWSIKRQSANRR